MAGYIFGGNTGETPQTLAKRRAVAEAIARQNGVPRNVGEGIASVGNAIAYRMMMNDIGKKETAGRDSVRGPMAALAAAFGGGGGAGPAVAAPGVASADVSALVSPVKANTANPNLPSRLDFASTEKVLAPHQRALLDTISGPESGGAYNVMYGGDRFDDFSKHPGQAVRIQSGPNAGKTSSAAGKYQFLEPTWNDQAQKLGLKDFSPGNQDQAAWNLAKESYANATGGDLDEVLQSGDPQAIASVGKALAPIWTSLPGGIEQGTNTNAFLSAYQGAMGGGHAPAAPVAAAQPAGVDPVQVASLDLSAGVYEAAQEQGITGQSPIVDALARLKTQESAPQEEQASPVVGALSRLGNAAPAAPEPAGRNRIAASMAGGAPDSAARPTQVAQSGPSMQQIMDVMTNPWATDEEKGFANMLYEQRVQENDPLRQLQMQKLQREVATPQKQWQKLDDSTLFDPSSGEIKRLEAPNGGAFRFGGTSVEAQSLNGLMDSVQLTPEQAQQLGAGKTITDPTTGAIIFMTPNGVFGQPAQGGPAQPIAPQTNAPPGTPAPVAAAPTAPPADGSRPGMIPVTDPKAVKPTEQQRNRKSAVDQAFGAITGELDRYTELVGKSGIEATPGPAKDQLNTVRQGIMLQMKELFNLGVLNGPDLSLMEKMIYDPVVDPFKEGGLINMPSQLWDATVGDPGARAASSVSELKRMLEGIKASVDTSIPGVSTAPANDEGWTVIDGVKIRAKR